MQGNVSETWHSRKKRNLNDEWRSLTYHQQHFDNFEVSNTGRLRNIITGTEYKTCINRQGYRQVCVSLGSKSKLKIFKIHRAVAETFIDNPDNKPQINHIDGNKLNNNYSNLEWVTPKENSEHACRMGLMKKPDMKAIKKLTDEQVKYVRENYIPGDKEFGARALARKFNIHHKTMEYILNNETYADVT